MRTLYTHIIRNLLLVVVLLLTSCLQDDNLFTSSTSGEGGVTLSFISDPMQKYNVSTRADIKDDDEKRINQLYIFFFAPDGSYLTGGYLTGYENAPKEGGYYVPGEGVTTLKLDNSKFTTPSDAKNATVFVVANVEPDLFRELGEDGRPKQIANMSDLENLIYKPKNPISLGIPEYGIPMVGKTTLDLTSESNEGERTIQLTALMARIDVTVQIDSPNAITNAAYPAFRMMDWTVSNIPNQVAFSSGLRTEDEEVDFAETTFEKEWKETITTPQQTIIHNRSGQISLSFYMFENRQKAEWKEDEGEIWQSTPPTGGDVTQEQLEAALYPKGLQDYQKQHYKPYLANKDAVAVELHGSYSTYNETGTGGATYEVRYTLYLGADFTSNFEVKSNHQYKNNITIKGLTQAGTNPDHITFDARVNITEDETSNKYYIAMLRERNHDAHFCITPMDVYLFADALNPTMEVILGEVKEGEEPAAVPDWVRMERVSAQDMKDGTLTSEGLSENTHIVAGANFTAGHGKRKYFTTGLFKEGESPLKTKATILNSRDRIYFYLDENLSDSQDRSAIVTLIYKENGVEKYRRYITLYQVHLLPIKVYNRDDDGNKKDVRQTIYMEQFEEYLDHYDPLDEFVTNQIYAGLPWTDRGNTSTDYTKNNIPTLYTGPYVWSGAVADPERVYYEGLEYTDFMVRLTGHLSMVLNERPTSAFEYCYNKNKRNSDGLIPQEISYNSTLSKWYKGGTYLKWFLPGIRQMEDALTQEYFTYPEFQSELYWSVSAGAINKWGSVTQDAEYARATGVNADGSYVESKGDGARGHKKRTESCRIRAFRIDLNPANY